MHEQGLLAAAAAALAETGVITEVTIAIGPGVDPDSAASAWRTAVRATPLAGAHVHWRRARDLLRCLDCAHEYRGDRLTRCPRCGQDGLVVEPAPELAIEDWRPAGRTA